jgi:hypothetical protein
MNQNVDLTEESVEHHMDNAAYSSLSSTSENSDEIFSMESLLQRVEKFQKREQLETL